MTDPMSSKELRKFGFVTGGMLILFFAGLIPWIWTLSIPVWPFYAAGVLAAMALIWPASLGPVYTVWMKFAEVLGWVNTRIILSVIFFAMFFPLGVIMRLFNDPMRRKLDETAISYRVESRLPKPENMEKPF